MDIAIEKLKEAGAKRVVPLKTSGPFHTSKLEKAKEAYSKELENVEFKQGKVLFPASEIAAEIDRLFIE